MGAADRRSPHSAARWRAACARALVAAASVYLGAAAPAEGAVSCTNPDALCRGNPCVTGTLEVRSPCVVDFGDRDLVIGGALKVPNGGLLTLSAGSIEVRRPILGRHTKQARGDGAHITLDADRDITVRWRIDASGRKTPGSILLRAGEDITLLAPVRAGASGSNPRAPGGTITLEAGGAIEAVHRARIRVHGDAKTAGGRAVLKAASGVHLGSRIIADGLHGGDISISSDTGEVFVEEPLEAAGQDGNGGAVTIVAASGTATVVEKIDVAGDGPGGEIVIVGAAGVTANGELRAASRARMANGGSVVAASDGDLLIRDTIFIQGHSGGTATLVSQSGSAHLKAPIVAAGHRGVGGTALLTGGEAIIVDSIVDADGDTDGGSITITARQVSLTSHTGLFARGANGGTVSVSGDTVSVVPGANVLVDGDQPGGTILLSATAGDLLLGGDFRARGRMGGTIAASAAGELIASGDFAARGNGCIAFSAGSTLDLSGGAFDVPVSDSCP